jgi:cobyric acid synthase CobQ/L-threonine-O-3-phosphate decarboxylase
MRIKKQNAEFEHGGNIQAISRVLAIPESELIDFSASINPAGYVEELRPAISRALETIVHYPDPFCCELRDVISKKYHVASSSIIVGNGATELIYILPEAIKPGRALVMAPSYSDYERAALAGGVPVAFSQLEEKHSFVPCLPKIDEEIKNGDMVFVGNPNNPAGTLLKAGDIIRLAKKRGDAFFVVDESFMDFVECPESVLPAVGENLAVVKSFTKFYALPGLRLGALFATKDVIEKVKKSLPMWSVNTLAQVAGVVSLKDEKYERYSRRYLASERERFIGELRAVPGLKVYDSAANFVLAKIEKKLTARELSRRLLEKKILIRDCSNFRGLDNNYFRVAIKTAQENNLLILALKEVLCGAEKKMKVGGMKRRAKTLMVQGVSSNAGKSVVVAALCRIFSKKGFKVAPFKAQNMSLNSFVTKNGEEIGRAQAMQAFAAGIEPDARMNPVLLKPCSDCGSQVIVRGCPAGTMKVSEYIKYKSKAFETIKKCFDELADEYEVIILEGAGSPAEVNLKQHDIVNMRMAEYASSPVLLVGDIDRGGVFASFIGTMETMAEWERKMVACFIVNKFRGNPSLLSEAYKYVEAYCGKPVVGTIPFIPNLELPEEDSFSLKESGFAILQKEPFLQGKVKIAVIDLPHISNFTDFDPLKGEPDVELVLAGEVRDIQDAAAIILPGSKNTIADFKYIQKRGIADCILEKNKAKECVVVGICGGLQMLGKEISDAPSIESASRNIKALALLPISTVMKREKTLLQVESIHLPSRLKVKGYEIHHGATDFKKCEPLFVKKDGEIIGAKNEDESVWGTYLHGVFDDDNFRRYFVDELRKKAGLKPLGKIYYAFSNDKAFDRLAKIFEKNVDMKKIYKLTL